MKDGTETMKVTDSCESFRGKTKPEFVRSCKLAKKRESKNDENEMNDAVGISQEENYVFFLSFYASLVSCTQSPSSRE